MDFLMHSRGTSSAAQDDHGEELNEQHWAYMDRFADSMTARGPTLGTDRQTWTGSLHVVDLLDPRAAREFVADEPYQQAGLFAGHLTWRFTNLLGRTMWEFPGGTDEPRFLILAHEVAASAATPVPVPAADLSPALRVRLILYGQLRDLDTDEPAGVALAAQAPTREVLAALLDEPAAGLAAYRDVEIHDWEFGGRR
jgi:uncharacterized protein